MKHITDYGIFESNRDDVNYTLDDVRKLPMYKALIGLGWEDITTPRGEKSLTIKLRHPKHGDYKYLTIQANGQLRTYYRGNSYPWITYRMRPKIWRDLYRKVDDWNDSLLYLLQWTSKTMGMGLNFKGINKGVPDEIMLDILEYSFKKSDGEAFLAIYNNAGEDVREKLAKKLNMDDDKINKIMNTKISVASAMRFT